MAGTAPGDRGIAGLSPYLADRWAAPTVGAWAAVGGAPLTGRRIPLWSERRHLYDPC
jgi:hypothetical protein